MLHQYLARLYATVHSRGEIKVDFPEKSLL